MLDNFPYSAHVPHQSQAPHKHRPYLRMVRLGKRSLIGAIVLLVTALSLQVLVPRLMPSASAGSSFLCIGFSDCSGKGYSDSGYEAHWGHMYWRMYSGRNCVNYTAYRLVARGLPDVRPWSGSGNAGNWGRAMRSITDQTPVVGSIAWWNYGAPGASSLGHVAYVERVVSSSEIVVSESNYGSDFDWRVITKSGSWPSGFIHFKDGAIENLRPPTMTGTARVGSPLSIVGGRWKPVSNASIQWYADGKPIAHQTRRTLTPTFGLLGKHLSARVTASLANYQSTSVMTPSSAAVAPGDLTLLASPRITGTPIAGHQLTVGGAEYEPAAHPAAIRWYANGQQIPGATGRVLTLRTAQAGKRISATVVGARQDWISVASSAASVGPVQLPWLTPASAGGVHGAPRYGRTLAASPGRFTASGVKVSYQWYDGSTRIKGATRPTYRTGLADLGQSIRVRVVARAAGYRKYVRTFALSGRVQARPSIRVDATGLKRAESIRIRIRGPHGLAPSGEISVMTNSRTKTARLVDGFVIVKFHNIPAGKRRVRVTYPGGVDLLARVKEVTTRVYQH